MNAVPKFSRIVLTSPWFLLVFLVVPIAVILTITLHIPLPFVGSLPLLANNVAFAALVACRLLWYLSRLKREIRYGEGGRPGKACHCGLVVADAQQTLARAGYAFAPGGGYGEKRDSGYLGTVLLYAGLLLLLSVGTWDNLRQFAGVLLDGPGPATKLSRVESYRNVTMGPLAARPDALPRMQITKQLLPDATHPRGATEITLLPEGELPVTALLDPTQEALHYGGYDIYMSKIVFEPQIVIKTKQGRTLYDSFVKLDPLVEKRGDFSFYGLFVGAEVVGGVYYQPEKSRMKMVVTRQDKRVVADMTFQIDQEVTKDEYVLSCAKMGQWSEIHVVRHRQKGLLWLGGILALIGLALRLAVRPRRVWLEEAPEGSRVTITGEEAKQLLKAS